MFSFTPQQAPTKEEKEFAALSYLWVFSLLIYFSPHKKSSFIRHHSKQAMMLFILSVIFYFLPKPISYINIFVVFLMVLGLIEAALGNWYRLPLLSDWSDGNFSHEKHFSLFHFWWQKGKDFIGKQSTQVFQNTYEAPKETQKTLEEYISGQVRKKWSPKIQEMEDLIEQNVEHESILIQKHSYGLEVIHERKTLFHFGGVRDDNFLLAYRTEDVFLPGDEQTGIWTIKHYSLSTLNRESFEALLKVIVDI